MKSQRKGFKLLATGAALAVLLALPSVAKGGDACDKQGKCERGGERSHSQRFERMSQKLELTEAQITQAKAIFESHKPEFERIKNEMQQTLTETQRQAMKEKRKDRRKNRAGPPSDEERAQIMTELGITEGQQQQLQTLREQMKSERDSIKSEMASVLTPEQQEKLEEMKSRRESRHRGGGSRG
jgi:Spy/CpxP family protein refolding chaperone